MNDRTICGVTTCSPIVENSASASTPTSRLRGRRYVVTSLRQSAHLTAPTLPCFGDASGSFPTRWRHQNRQAGRVTRRAVVLVAVLLAGCGSRAPVPAPAPELT